MLLNLIMNCPLCRSEARVKFKRQDTFVWECLERKCTLEFLYPQPGEGELNAAYATLYYPANANAHKVTFENTPVEVLEQAFEHLTKRLGILHGIELLDYGCGRGKLCALAARLGMSVVGMEPSPTARMEARKSGLTVFGSLGELKDAIPNARFDVVMLWDVIEHLREPWADLRLLRSVLKPGGRVVVSTMNTKSLRARLEGPRWENYSNPTHTFFFNRRSLGSMISRAGFPQTEEWIVPIWYPQHGFLRRILHRVLMATSLNSEIVFVGRNKQEDTLFETSPIAINADFEQTLERH